jgi:N utilization substance protein B
MSIRQQPRRTARILSLLSLSQVKGNTKKLEDQTQDVNDLVVASIRTLTTEIEDVLETASDELIRSNEQIFHSETRSSSIHTSRTMLKEAIALTQKAINRLGSSLELPEFVNVSNQVEVREYALELINTVNRRREEIDQILNEVMVDWQVSRLPQIDRNILRLAVAEMAFLEVNNKVAINEAVEIAKRYSDEDGYRFINGVLRKVTDKLKHQNNN